MARAMEIRILPKFEMDGAALDNPDAPIEYDIWEQRFVWGDFNPKPGFL